MLNLGTLTMVDCDVNNNIGSFYGAGVTNSGNLILQSCKVHRGRRSGAEGDEAEDSLHELSRATEG